jgi:hypothetical protein
MASTITKVTGRTYRVLADNTPNNYVWNQLSFWTAASDVEFEDGTNAETKLGAIQGITTSTSITTTGYAADASVTTALYKKTSQFLTATLAAGSTSVSFTNSNFDGNTLFDVYTSVYGVNPTAMSLSGTTLRLTFDSQSSAVTVKLRYFKI